MDDELLKRIAYQLAVLSITVTVLKSELVLLKHIDHEWIDSQVRDKLLTPDGRYVQEAIFLALRGK